MASYNASNVNSTIRLVVKTNLNTLASSLKTQGGPSAWYLRKLSSMFGAFSDGAWASNTVATLTCVAATGTVTLSSLANNDTVTINGRVYTAKTSGATGLNQFNLGASDTTAATNLAAAINADTSILVVGNVTATSATTVVTLTAAVPGNIGNNITLAISAHGSVSGAKLTGGTEGTTNTFAHGL